MPADFTVEDGTGLADANSYATANEAREYWNDRGVVFTETDDELQLSLVNATDYIEVRFYGMFKGCPEFPEVQALSWPRLYVYNKNGALIEGVPQILKNACAEYMRRDLASALLPDPTLSVAVKRQRNKVGPLETETEYLGGVVPRFNKYTKPDLMMRELITGDLSALTGRSYR